MAISFVGSTSGGAINGGNVTLTLPGAYTTNDVAYVAVTLGTSKAAALSVTSSSGGAYTQVVASITSSLVRFGVFRQIVPSSAGLTQAIVTGTGGSTDATSAIVHIFRNVSTTNPEDATATSTIGNSTSPDSPSITVVNAEDVIITSVGWSVSARSLTAPSGFSDAVTRVSTDTNPCQTGQAWITNLTTSPYNPAVWTSTGAAAGWCSATIALRSSAIPTGYGSWGAGPDSSNLIDEARRVVVRSYF